MYTLIPGLDVTEVGTLLDSSVTGDSETKLPALGGVPTGSEESCFSILSNSRCLLTSLCCTLKSFKLDGLVLLVSLSDDSKSGVQLLDDLDLDE